MDIGYAVRQLLQTCLSQLVKCLSIQK